MRWLARCLFAVGLTLLAAGARAQNHPAATIVVVAPPGDRFGMRVSAELASLGFRAVMLDPAAVPASRVSLEAWARQARAIAAIRAVPSEHGVEVWIADRVTGKTVLRELTSEGGAPEPEASLAIRTVELLRASLLEVALPAAPPGEVSSTPEIQDKLQVPVPGSLEDQAAPAFRISIGLGALGSPGGLGASPTLDFGVAYMPSDHVGVSAFAAVSLDKPSISRSGGSVDLSVILAGAGMRFLFTTRASTWAPSLDLGAALVSLKSTGVGALGSAGGEASAVTGAPFARLGLAYAVTPLFRLRTDLLVGVVAPGVSLRVAGQDAASWGRPFFLGGAGVDFGWF